MKFIPISNSTKVAIVDDEDYERVSFHTWWVSSCRVYTEIADVSISLAKFILGNPPEGKDIVDHADRDPFNNQKCNLRFATNSQNAFNRSNRLGKSGYRGVTWLKDKNKWKAYITVNKKTYNLGHFDDKNIAAETYNEAAIKYYGEFAILNVIKVESK